MHTFTELCELAKCDYKICVYKSIHFVVVNVQQNLLPESRPALGDGTHGEVADPEEFSRSFDRHVVVDVFPLALAGIHKPLLSLIKDFQVRDLRSWQLKEKQKFAAYWRG